MFLAFSLGKCPHLVIWNCSSSSQAIFSIPNWSIWSQSNSFSPALSLPNPSKSSTSHLVTCSSAPPMTPTVSCFSSPVCWCDLQCRYPFLLWILLPGRWQQRSLRKLKNSLGRVIYAGAWTMPSNRRKNSKQDMSKPAKLPVVVAPLFLIPSLANLRPYLVFFALQLLVYLQGKKTLKKLNEWQRYMYV